MLRLRSRPLKNHLVLLILGAVLLPAALTAGFSIYHLAGMTRADTERHNLALARSVAGEVEALLRAPTHVLANLRETLLHPRGPKDAEALGHLLDTHVAGQLPGHAAEPPLFDSILLLGVHDTVTATGLPEAFRAQRPGIHGLQLGHLPFVRQARAQGTTAWSDTFFSLVSGRMSLALAVPVDSETLLVGNLNLTTLQRVMRSARGGQPVAVALLDRSGAVLAHSRPEEAARGVHYGHLPPVREALAGQESTQAYRAPEGRAIGSAVPIRGLGWATLVSQDTAAAFAPIRRTARIAASVASLALALGLGLALAVARRYSEPLVRLTTQAQQAAAGHYQFPTVTGPFQEVETLSQTFAEMLEALDTREHQLVESERRFRELADLLPQVVFEMDPDGTITYANRQGTALFGWSGEALARGLPVARTIAPEDRQRALDNIGRRSRGEVAGDNEYRMVTAAGREFPALIYSAPIERDGRVLGLRGVLIDISERRALEEQIRQSQKMEAVGTLASGIAHDFNNLLQAISGFTELLLADTTDAGSRQRLDRIAAATANAAALVQQILAFSRRRPLALRHIDLNDEVHRATEMLLRTLPKMIHIETHLDPQLWPLSADPTQVQQVVMNLGTNARDAMPTGGRLVLTTRNRRLVQGEHPHLSPGNYVELAVADDGTGIDPQTQTRIFEPFFTTKAVDKGTGLGLSTAYGILKAHGGDLQCTSAPGAGTVFTITLPALTDPTPVPAPPPPGPTASTPARGDERVLVVDDEHLVRELATQALSDQGYQVSQASNGEEALEHYRTALDRGPRSRFHAVILDLGMPGMGGYRCLEELLRLDPAARVLVASGYGSRALPAELQAAGAAGFLAKPYRTGELCQALRTVLDPPPGERLE